jgi:exodeoxyribonuclease V alpha subunit
MITTSELGIYIRSLFPRAGKELLNLYDGAVEKGGLQYTEICTIHDLLDLSGYGDDEPVHALLILMLAALDEGSVCIDTVESALAERLANFLDETEAQDWAQRIRKRLHAPGYPNLIGAEGVTDRPVILCQGPAGDLLYFQKLLKYETDFLTSLRNRLTQAASTNAMPPNLASTMREMLIHWSSSGKSTPLQGKQQLGLALSLLKNLVIITGGPGTGKTSIVFALLRCLVRQGFKPESIALAAPTGLAAQRLTEAIRKGVASLPSSVSEAGPDASLQGLSAQTLHRLLVYQPSRGTFRHHADNPLPYDVVIVDEISMVGLVLMAQLFDAVKPETKFILLGDKDQLPSVEAGAILGQLTPSDGQPCFSEEVRAQLTEMLPDLRLPAEGRDHWLRDTIVMLDENYRSQRQIQEVAQAINMQDETILERMPCFKLSGGSDLVNGQDKIPYLSFAELSERGGCWRLEMTSLTINEWHRCLRRWVDFHYLTKSLHGSCYADVIRTAPLLGTNLSLSQENILTQLFEHLGQVRILTLIREGPWGCDGINLFLSNYLKPRFGQAPAGRLFAGAPILITRNDYERDLFNGDVGVALQAGGGGYGVVFKRADGFLIIREEALPAYELAFAVTVHKSQGSEYGQVMLVVPPEGGRRLLTKEVIYTGITRAKDLAIVAGSKEVLRASLRRKMKRTSGLGICE